MRKKRERCFGSFLLYTFWQCQHACIRINYLQTTGVIPHCVIYKELSYIIAMLCFCIMYCLMTLLSESWHVSLQERVVVVYPIYNVIFLFSVIHYPIAQVNLWTTWSYIGYLILICCYITVKLRTLNLWIMYVY